MKIRARLSILLLAFGAVTGFSCVFTANVAAQTMVAAEDFDSGQINLLSGFDTLNNLTLLPHCRFGVFENNQWAIDNCAPYSFADDSVADVSTDGELSPYKFDFEGILGTARDRDDAFFLIADASSFYFDPFLDLTVSWVFDVSSGADDLTFQIDMGQNANDEFGGVPDFNIILFEYRIDGGAFNELFSVVANELVGTGFSYRPMDSGNVTTIDFNADGTHRGCSVFTNFPVTKILADTGQLATDTYLDKSDPATGNMDTFKFDLNEGGNTLEIRMSAEFSFASFVMDNMAVQSGIGVLKGDVNLDGVINLLDIDPFIFVLGNGLFQAEADTNCDGTVDLLDIDPFILLVGGG